VKKGFSWNILIAVGLVFGLLVVIREGIVVVREYKSIQNDSELVDRDRIDLFGRRDAERKLLGEIRDQLKLLRSDMSRRNNGSIGEEPESK